MITADSKASKYTTEFSNGTASGIADVTRDKGGQGEGFRPHDLLEAALATCVNMTVRMYADHHGIAVSGIKTTVTMERRGEETVLRCQVEIGGDLDAATKAKLLAVAQRCPVRATLSKPIRFSD